MTDHFTSFAVLLDSSHAVNIQVDLAELADVDFEPARMSVTSNCGDGTIIASVNHRGIARFGAMFCEAGYDMRVDRIATDTVTGEHAVASAILHAMPGTDDEPTTIAAETRIGDGDSDGFTAAQGDCDDDNNAIYPGAADPIDDLGLDSNCDGLDGVDADGDRYSTAFDCDDTDRTVHPGRSDTGFFLSLIHI